MSQRCPELTKFLPIYELNRVGLGLGLCLLGHNITRINILSLPFKGVDIKLGLGVCMMMATTAMMTMITTTTMMEMMMMMYEYFNGNGRFPRYYLLSRRYESARPKMTLRKFQKWNV